MFLLKTNQAATLFLFGQTPIFGTTSENLDLIMRRYTTAVHLEPAVCSVASDAHKKEIIGLNCYTSFIRAYIKCVWGTKIIV